jgi:hypothetical protein
MGHLELKTRSPELKIEIPCGHIFASIIIKLGQDACLGDSSDEFVHGSSRIKN